MNPFPTVALGDYFECLFFVFTGSIVPTDVKKLQYVAITELAANELRPQTPYHVRAAIHESYNEEKYPTSFPSN